MAKEIQVFVKEPGKPGEIRKIPNTLGSLQGLVGGYIEAVYITPSLAMVVNEEGKIHGLEPNFPWGSDIIVGTVVFVGTRGSAFSDLPQEYWGVVKAYTV